jgi:hypothetical protein
MVTTSKVITKKIEVEVIETIFYWTTKPAANPSYSPNCHCLLRIFIYPNQNKAIVIASELFSNDSNIGVSPSYTDLAQKVIQDYPQLKQIENLIWLGHSGQFGTYLSWAHHSVKENFYIVSLQFNSQGNAEEIDDERYISTEQLRELLEGVSLEPAVITLKQLEHDNGWGGIVDDEQVKACMELEQGIILGKKTDGVTPAVGWFCL